MRNNDTQHEPVTLVGLALVLGLFALALAAGSPSQAASTQAVARTWYVDGNCTVCGAGTLDTPISLK